MILLSNRLWFGIPAARWLLLITTTAALLLIAASMRSQLSLEWNLSSLRVFVESLGIWGPLAYIGILVFRFLFLIPSTLLLLAAGILFGSALGALYAGLGLFGSALWKYGLVSLVGQRVVLRQLPIHLQTWITKFAHRKTSVWALGGICAYPFLPKHIFQFGAILSGMGFGAYLVAVATGSFMRASAFAWLGHALYSGIGLAAVTLTWLTLLAAPMSVPTWRHWILEPLTTTKPRSNP